MSLKTRRIIYLLFILAFVIISVVVLLYTSGYRYNFKKGVMQKTGVLVVESYPKDMKIWINDELKEEKTPAVISSLLPQKYNIKVGRSGYQIWEKDVRIYPARSTFIDYIEVFKSPSTPVYNKKHTEESGRYTLSDSYSRDIYKFYTIKKENRIYIEKENILSSTTSTVSTLPVSVYKFLNFEGVSRYFSVKDILNDIIYIFRIDNFGNIKDSYIFKPAKGMDFNNDNDKVMYFNDYEIWITDLNSGRKYMIVRLSKKIDDAIWSESDRSIIYISQDKVYAIEAYDLADRMQYILGEAKNARSLLYLKKGVLYIEDSKDGVWSMQIQ